MLDRIYFAAPGRFAAAQLGENSNVKIFAVQRVTTNNILSLANLLEKICEQL